MVYQLKRTQTNKRPQAFWGSLIPSALSFVGGLITSSQQAKAQRRALEEQQRLAKQQLDINNQNQLASTLNNYVIAQQSYDDKDYNLKYRIGGVKRLGSRNIMITDGGNAKRIGNNTYLLRGGSHEDINETGQTGIGINVGGNEIEAEGGEVAQRKGNSLRIYSAQPILGGISPAEAIMRGYNKDKVFNAQQRFKKNNGIKDDGSKAKYGTTVPYKRIHINEDGTFTDTLTGKNYTTSATNGEDIVITGKANHWKEAGKKDTSSYFDPMGAVNFVTAAGAPILNANPSNIIGSIRDSKNASDFIKHYMMQDTGGFVDTKWAKEHPYLSLGINAVGDIGLGIGANKAVDILRHPLEYGKYGYKLNKFYKKAGLLNRGDYKTAQQNYEKALDYQLGNRPYDEGALSFNYAGAVRDNAERINPDLFYTYNYPSKEERIIFKRLYNKKATDNVFTEMHTPIRYGFNKGDIKKYDNLINHNPEYYNFLEQTGLPWDEQSTVDAFLQRQQRSIRGVHANNKEKAKEYLTSLRAKRIGGDRLNTNGGLYTSNSTGIADAFKNPVDNISNGYIGKLFYNFGIDKSKPIANQLREARSKIVIGGHNNIFAGTNHYSKSINKARNNGAIAIEDNYGRSNGDRLKVTERAYFPSYGEKSNINLEKLDEYINQNNKHGRWNTSGIDYQSGDEEFFIPKEYNRFDDFIREAKIFMQPRKEYDYDKSMKFIDNVADRTIKRSKYRNKLIDMSRRLLRRNERNSNNFDVFKTIPITYFDEPFRLGGHIKFRNGGLTSKDRGSSKHPYPSVASKDFAGGGRSYPIPTKVDAIDALRLAGLHGRSDVRSKVYNKYPELRKKARGGTKVEPYYDWARNTSSNLGISFIDPTYDYRTYYNSVTPYERNLIRFAPQGTHFTDIGKTPKHPTFSNESIYSNKKHSGGTWNGNVFVPNIWQFGNNGNKVRNKYMNNSGEGYFNGRINIFPKYRKRIAKRIGGITNPPVERFKCGGRIRPKAEKGMLAPIYSYGSDRRRLPSFATIDITPRAIPNFKPVSVPTNAKTPFDPNSVPFLGNQSTFKPATQDYIGLGIDTLAALGSGMFTRSAYNKMNFDYALPNYVDESPVAFDTTYHNEAQRANIERNRLNARNLIRGNTASAQTSLGRMQQSDVDAMMETNKLLDEKSNKEVELRNQNAANEQQVRARNAAARNQYYQNVAQIKNAAIEAKNNMELAKAQSIGADLSGLSQAWTNFAGSVESRYDNRQKEAIIAATAKDPAVLSNAVQFGYNFSPEVLAAIYNSTDDDNLKSLALSQLSTKNRLRYGIR